jgi:hypothetical protein
MNTLEPAVSCDEVNSIAFVQRFLKIRVAPGTSDAFGNTPVNAVDADNVVTPQTPASKVLPEVAARTLSTAKGEKPRLLTLRSSEIPLEVFEVATGPDVVSTRKEIGIFCSQVILNIQYQRNFFRRMYNSFFFSLYFVS